MSHPKITFKPPTGERKHRGVRSELLACAWLLGEGYEVFRNISPHGTVDLVATKGGRTVLLDVKSVADNGNGTIASLTPAQRAAGVIVLLVWPDGRCRFGAWDGSASLDLGKQWNESRHRET
jgi:hypothetical protein